MEEKHSSAKGNISHKEDQVIFFAFEKGGEERKVTRIGRISGRIDLVVLGDWTGT